MQELEKILEKIIKKSFCVEIREYESETVVLLDDVEEILEKHMNDGWILVEEPPKKDYTAVFVVDKHDYYFVAVYDKEHGYRTNDVGADVDNIVAYCLFNPYCPERSDNNDGE